MPTKSPHNYGSIKIHFAKQSINATFTAKVISWRSVTHMCFLAFSQQHLHNFSFQSHQLLFSHASAQERGENTPERKVTSTGDQTHNHQVLSPTCSQLNHQGGAIEIQSICRCHIECYIRHENHH